MIGFVIALGILSGDQQGRVNLLYLLSLFAFLPVAGLLLSLVFMFRGNAFGLSGLLLKIPLWPGHWARSIHILPNPRTRKFWFLYQTQVLVLGFGAGALVGFFIMLIGSDVSFVWRSTLLEAENLHPVLKTLALPWEFWREAQPSLNLLRETQDFRLIPPEFQERVLGQWWRYLLAAQLTYNLFPRTLVLLVARMRYLDTLEAAAKGPLPFPPSAEPLNTVPPEEALAPVVYGLGREYDLIDWNAAPESCLEYVGRAIGPPGRVFSAGPLAAPEVEAASLHGENVPVILVKSWEPPMGELKDYLRDRSGFILPLDWDGAAVKGAGPAHLQEWRRFCGSLTGWTVLQPGDKS